MVLRRSTTPFVLSLGLFAGTLGAACTQTLDFQQCRNNADCRNQANVDLICSLDNECVSRPQPSEVSCDRGCVAVLGDGHICGPSGRCASLESAQCSKLVIPLGSNPEDLVFLGSILAVSPPFTSAIAPIQNAVQLAVEDFNAVTFLPGGRKIGWVGCDSGGSAEGAVAAAEHLVNDLGVVAIVGPAFSEEVLAVAEQVTIPSGTFLISPTATTRSLTTLDDNGLVWRTIGSDAAQATAIADRLALLDPLPGRVMIFVKGDAYGLGLSEDVSAGLRTALPNAAVAVLPYLDPAVAESPDALQSAYASTIAQGFEHNADVVVVLGTGEVEQIVLSYLLAQEFSERPYPRILVSHAGVPSLPAIVGQVAPEFQSTLAGLLEGVSPNVQDSETFASFNVRYRVRFSELNALTAASLGYDAAMVSLLAMSALGEAEPTGLGIAQAMPQLADLQATRILFSSDLTQVAVARDALVAGQPINIHGVSGSLDFDLVAGEVRSDLLGWDVVASGTAADLVPARAYILDAAPSVSGNWVEL